MEDKRKKVIASVRKLLVESDLDLAMEILYGFLATLDEGLANEVILQQQRLSRIETDHSRQVISYDDYQLELNRISASVLYLLDQIPETGGPPSKSGGQKKKGRLLHDIPPKMPVGLETRCTVRIAEEESVLLEGYEWTDHTELEDIAISKVMEVELIDFGEEKHFSIRTFSSGEQSVEKGDFTQWLFFVKPLLAGVHTLYLKVSTIRVINNKERKKEVVLERQVDVVSEPGEVMSKDSERNWQDTKITLTAKKASKKASKKGGFTLPDKGFGMIVDDKDHDWLYTHQPKEQAGWDDLKDDFFRQRKSLEQDRNDPFDEKHHGGEPFPGNRRIGGKVTRWDTTRRKPAARKKATSRLTDELIPKEQVKAGEMIRVLVKAIGVGPEELTFILDDNRQISPAERQGNQLIFHLFILQSPCKITVTKGRESISRELDGSRCYEWTIRLKRS